MNKIDIAKKTLGFAASIGSGTIVGAIVRNNVTTRTPLETVTVTCGAFALGGAAGRVAMNEMTRTVDEVAEAFRALRNKDTEKAN